MHHYYFYLYHCITDSLLTHFLFIDATKPNPFHKRPYFKFDKPSKTDKLRRTASSPTTLTPPSLSTSSSTSPLLDNVGSCSTGNVKDMILRLQTDTPSPASSSSSIASRNCDDPTTTTSATETTTATATTTTATATTTTATSATTTATPIASYTGNHIDNNNKPKDSRLPPEVINIKPSSSDDTATTNTETTTTTLPAFFNNNKPRSNRASPEISKKPSSLFSPSSPSKNFTPSSPSKSFTPRKLSSPVKSIRSPETLPEPVLLNKTPPPTTGVGPPLMVKPLGPKINAEPLTGRKFAALNCERKPGGLGSPAITTRVRTPGTPPPPRISPKPHLLKSAPISRQVS